ncbi:MAG: hypothetical protein A2X12_07175 [Bacteroidetes bacterium GWE2_29_8]|nr:MAG: hypothetical protein A2X12_07175 [Bacteroidetes bacterium GWE2_29_8]
MENKTHYKQLKFESLKNMGFWDLYAYDKSVINAHFPVVKMNEVLKLRKDFFTIDDNENYKLCRVQLHGKGVVLRDTVKGKDIKTKKQQRCKPNDFLVAEIDAKVGGYGIVPDFLEDAIVSGHYFLFEINKEKLLPDFLSILVKCDGFSKQVKATGSTNYAAIRPYHVLDYKIPLPSIENQIKIVAAYQHKIKLAEQQELKYLALEHEIEEYLSSELGIISKKKSTPKKGLQFYSFKNTQRWDFWNESIEYHKQTYELIRLSSLISIQSGRFLPKSAQKKGSYIIYGGNGKTGEHSEFIYEGKRLLIGRVGEYCGNVHLIEGKYWITDNAFKVDKISEKVTYEYLELALTALNLNNFKVLSAQPSISQGAVLALSIPVPSTEIQNKIVKHIYELKIQVISLKQQSEQNRNLALQDFENEIFKIQNHATKEAIH